MEVPQVHSLCSYLKQPPKMSFSSSFFLIQNHICAHVHVNEKMISVEIIPGMGKGGDEEEWLRG
jgi:hypothetical protein